MPAIVDYVFTSRDIDLNYIFVSLEIITKNKKAFITKTAHFLRNRGHGFAQRLFPQMCTAFKAITPKIFITVRESSQKNLLFQRKYLIEYF